MSEQNVEVIRRMIDVWNDGDLTAWAENLHQEIEWTPVPEMTEGGSTRGVEPTLHFLQDWITPWESYAVEATQIVDAGDAVMLSTRQSGRDRSGTEVSMEMHGVASFDDGKVIAIRWFLTEDEARAAADLPGEAA